MITLEELEERTQRFVEAEWAEFMQSLRDYPTHEAWLNGYELPHLAAIKERRHAYELQKSGASAVNMPPERCLDTPPVE